MASLFGHDQNACRADVGYVKQLCHCASTFLINQEVGCLPLPGKNKCFCLAQIQVTTQVIHLKAVCYR